MTQASTLRVAVFRVAGASAILGILIDAYVLRVAVGDGNPFDFFGYFTNQTALLTSIVLIVTGVLTLRRRPVPAWLCTVRAIATTSVIIVAFVYNVIVPGTGSAPPWISTILHIVFPALVILDWMLVRDRPALPWRQLPLVLVYPGTWLVVVLVRGATDGWVPYGFLLPERGVASLALTVIALAAALMVAGTMVWAASRFRGLSARAVPRIGEADVSER
ncbi:Pr6Pr family membrane protein [Microbacterium sp.]|uniref:Pr6Pr family membrane protein n=1 Tax=Microbacterium sp. TaxID=51671 RepID=UPI003C77ECE1